MAPRNNGETAREIATLLLAFAALNYAASLFLPAFSCRTGRGYLGLRVLVSGWMGFIAGDFRWIANILLPITALMVRTHLRRPIVYGPHVVVQAMPALALVALMIWSITTPAYGCPGGYSAPAISTGLGIGGYLWVASNFLVCAAYIPMYFVRSVASAEADSH